MKTPKTWKLLLASALLLIAALSPRPARAFGGGGDPCWQVCSYGPDEYCYYGDGCVASCCRYDDWLCLNPCSP
jgi:hypothetical protein